MKILDVTSISSSVAMPVKSGTLQFLQDSHKEALNGLMQNIIEIPVVDTIYILSGCVNSLTAPNYDISPGVLFLNGEIYDFDGAAFITIGLQKAYARIETTQFLTNADPVQFTDGINRNVHNIRKIVIENTITSSGLPEFKDFIKVGSSLKGDTKEVVCDSTYMGINFDGTGLGRLERKGWAIMNGNNGTVNDNGRVVIAFGTSFATLGATGGASTHTLVENELPVISPINGTAVKKGGTIGGSIGITAADQDNGNYAPGELIKPFGGGLAHNNMQPYIVRLRIQKI